MKTDLQPSEARPVLMRLSQGQLNTLAICPRKFQHLYLDQLGFPPSPEQQERMTWGTQFHRLIQQYQLGLPVPLSSITDQGADSTAIAMQQSVNALIQAVPHLADRGQSSLLQSEHRRTLNFQGYLLTVIYDLLILQDQQAQILDWKTYPKPLDTRRLAQDWQTRLYLFVLAETSDYNPEQISMTYWFVQAKPEEAPQPRSLNFTYSTMLHEQTRQELNRLLAQLTDFLQRYDADGSLPQVEPSKNHCSYCPFAVRCQREAVSQENQPPALPLLSEIQEIVL